MIKTKYWIIIFAVLLLVLGGLSLWIYGQNGGGTIAAITQDGKLIDEIDLSKVTESYEFTVSSSDGGVNTVRVEKGRICIVDADCPDHTCVHQSWISDGTFPIVCLPHKLVIEISSGTQDIADIKAG